MFPTTDPRRAERVPFLDGLRGLAVLLVVTGHYFYQPGNSLPPESWTARLLHFLCVTWFGVDLFFVLSGFLLGGILLDHRRADNLFRVFYWRRACRILPAYLLFLSPLAVFGLFGLGERFPVWQEHLSTGEIPPWVYPFFLQNIVLAIRGSWGEAWIGPTWSLGVEEQFYLLIPLLVRYVPPRRLPAVLLGMVLVAPVCRVAITLLAPVAQARVGAYMLLPCRWDSLLLGALAAWALRDPAVKVWLREHVRGMRRTLAGLLAGCAVLAAIAPEGYSLPMRTVGYTWFAAAFALLLLCGTMDVLPGRGWLEAAWLRRIGRVSYTLYLIHVPVSCLVFHLAVRHARTMNSLRDAGLMFASFVIALLMAEISWRCYEGPILAWGRSFRYAKPAPLPPTGPAGAAG
jgi:peptidoglycan/LPS O-acetylase OafA/YrhL